MVDNKYYNEIIGETAYNINDEEVYPKSFVLYRFAKDKKIEYSSESYQKYNFIIKKDS